MDLMPRRHKRKPNLWAPWTVKGRPALDGPHPQPLTPSHTGGGQGLTLALPQPSPRGPREKNKPLLLIFYLEPWTTGPPLSSFFLEAMLPSNPDLTHKGPGK